MDPALPQNVSLPSTEQPSERALVQEQLQETILVNDTPNEVVSSSENIETNDLYCEFCGLAVNSKMQMDMHLKGAKHKNAVTSEYFIRVPSFIYKCLFFKIIFNSEYKDIKNII